jgi:glycogen operon protein
MRNLLATVFLSQGVPMLLAGDEFGRSQQGNNNAYCQDNDTNWLDWQLADRNAAQVAFVRQLVDLRKSRLWLRRDTFLKGTRRGAHAKDITWLHPDGREMSDGDWNDSSLVAIAVHLNGAHSRQASGSDLLIAFNAGLSPVELRVPAAQNGEGWHVLFDTSVPALGDQDLLQCNETLRVAPRSTVLLEARGA